MRWVWLLCAVVVVWTFASIAVQGGPRALGLAALAVAAAGVLTAAVFGLFKIRFVSVLTVAVIPLALWVSLWGSYSFLRDVLGGAVGVALAWPVAHLLLRWRGSNVARPRRQFMRTFLLFCFLFIWVINSALDVLLESQPVQRLGASLPAAQAEAAPWPALRVGVALSGGGYRAGLMHAGVLAELNAMQVPVTNLSCVSGGAIIGSFYASGGAPQDFRDAIAAGRMNLKRDMADIHNVLRLPFPGKIPYLDVELLPWLTFGRVDVQANLVDRVLLDGATLGDMRAPGLPHLQICTTDLRTGMAVGLAADGAAIRSAPRPARARSGGALPYEVDRDFHPALAPDTRVADLVAASGAFPGAFGAVEVTLPAVGGRPARRFLLADGGIMDNWAVGLLLDRHRAAEPDGPWRLDVLVISAGGRIFKEREVPVPEELRRAIDIVYETAGWRPVEEIDGADRPPIVLLQPTDLDEELPEYRAFANATTLTDKYTPEQAQRLFDLGGRLVRNADLVTILDKAQATRTVPEPSKTHVSPEAAQDAAGAASSSGGSSSP